MSVDCWATHDSAGRFVMTDDRDCLPADCYSIVRYEYASVEEALECAKRVEENSTEITFQVGDVFYETEAV